MSSNSSTDVVLRGVTHGAVDFLIKPVRLEELRNAWQHVVRRKRGKVRRNQLLCLVVQWKSTVFQLPQGRVFRALPLLYCA